MHHQPLHAADEEQHRGLHINISGHAALGLGLFDQAVQALPVFAQQGLRQALEGAELLGPLQLAKQHARHAWVLHGKLPHGP